MLDRLRAVGKVGRRRLKRNLGFFRSPVILIVSSLVILFFTACRNLSLLFSIARLSWSALSGVELDFFVPLSGLSFALPTYEHLGV